MAAFPSSNVLWTGRTGRLAMNRGSARASGGTWWPSSQCSPTCNALGHWGRGLRGSTPSWGFTSLQSVLASSVAFISSLVLLAVSLGVTSGELPIMGMIWNSAGDSSLAGPPRAREIRELIRGSGARLTTGLSSILLLAARLAAPPSCPWRPRNASPPFSAIPGVHQACALLRLVLALFW